MSEIPTHISNAFGGVQLDHLLVEKTIHTRASDIIQETSWPKWLKLEEIQKNIQDCYQLQASILGFNKQEQETIGKLNMLSLVRVCQNHEGASPDTGNHTGGFINSYLLEFDENQGDLNEYMTSLFNSAFTNISLYPHRMKNIDEFIANLYHEVTHHLIEIRIAQMMIKRGKNYKDWIHIEFDKKHKRTSLSVIVHEAFAHLEGAQRIAYSNINEAWRQSGSEWSTSDEYNNPYKIGSDIGHTIYRAQVGIYNSLGGIPLSPENYIRFEKWGMWIREELIECIFDSERLELVSEVLSQYENNPQGFLEFFEEKIVPLL